MSEHAKKAFLTESEINGLTAFKASKSRAGKFADSGWCSQSFHGEAGSVDVVALDPEIQKLQDLIKKYNSDEVLT